MLVADRVTAGGIPHLTPLLRSWVALMGRYLRRFASLHDRPWWYNERATLSLLAAAAWEAGGVALEEYSTRKGTVGKPSDLRLGRCDLFVSLAGGDFACEAKQVWAPIGRTATRGVEAMRVGLNDACRAARRLRKAEGRRLALCFGVPYLPRRDRESIDAQLSCWLGDVRSLKWSSFASSFPKSVRGTPGDDGYYYPGVVLLIKEVFRQA
jgi:hypothetical protein